MRPVDLVGVHLEPDLGVPVVVLREHAEPNRFLPVFVGPSEAAAIALVVQGVELPRPGTHDLMTALVERLDAEVDRIEVTGRQDGTFVADLVLRTPGGPVRLDARPSDAIALAVRTDAPLFVSEEVLAESGLVVDETGEAAIDAELDQFRAFLTGVDPADFALDDPPTGALGDGQPIGDTTDPPDAAGDVGGDESFSGP
jgi:bifunctional DNase/RNase